MLEPVPVPLLEPLRLPLGVFEPVPLGDAPIVRDDVSVDVWLGFMVPLCVPVGVPLLLGVTGLDALALGDRVPLCVPVRVPLMLAVCVPLDVALRLPVALADRLGVADRVLLEVPLVVTLLELAAAACVPVLLDVMVSV